MLFRLGLPTNIIMIAAIATGALFSYVHVLRFYALSFTLINLPLVMYYGFKRSFGYETREILSFWTLKILLSALLIFSIWLEYRWVTPGLVLLYLVHLIIRQRQDIQNIYKFLLKKARRLS